MAEHDLKEMVRRIEVAILGDEGAGIEGLVKKVERHDRQLQMIQRMVWIGAGVALVFTIGYNVVKLVL